MATRVSSPTARREGGFSLVELLVAMVVTMLVAGGIMGLLYDSNRTFGREPAISEQQQNARIALSMIESDLVSAGAGAGAFIQAFTNNLDNSAAGPPSIIQTLAGNPGERTDVLEMRAAVDECSSIQLCNVDGGAGSVTTYEPLPDCMRVPGLVVITDANGHSYTRWACVPGNGTNSSCQGGGSGGPNGHLGFPAGAGAKGCTVPGQNCNPNGHPLPGMSLPAWMTVVNLVRYEIRVGTDGVPNLWRSPTAGLGASASGNSCDPDAFPGGNSQDWQLVARGIEDLQVRYRRPANDPADDFWADTPGAVACQDDAPCANPGTPQYDTIVREVEVRISARVLSTSPVAGEITVAGSTARRSELRTVISPRGALLALSQRNQFK